MDAQTMVPILSLVAGLMYLPPVFLPLLRFEVYNSRTKYVAHTAIALAFLALAYLSHAFPAARPPVVAALLVFYCEVAVRVTFAVLARFGGPRFAQLEAKITDLGCYGDPAQTRIQGHPFLQFTGRIGKPAGYQRRNAYGDYGFVGISQADVAKPPNTVRIACLGGSTTEYGYPKFLEEFLHSKGAARAQVLNFGLSWWTTIHSLVNYVLNVRDFRPDILVIHHNVNDHKYRGYPRPRGDGSHAFVPWHYRGAPDRWLIHFSVIYRLLRLKVQAFYRWLPKFGDFPEEQDKFSQILQRKGKSLVYRPEELALYRRNVETILDLARIEGSLVVLTTMPFLRNVEGELSTAIRGHMIEVNELIRELARERSLPLVDLEKTAADENLFADMVHMNKAGDRRKAEEIGRALLSLPLLR